MTRHVFDVLAEVNGWGSYIATELTKRGITGKPGCGKTCPMATYIIGEVSPGDVDKIHVDAYTTDVWDRDGESTTYDNPDNMKRFILDFDDGEYRDLVTDPDLYFPEWDEDEMWDDEPDEDFEEPEEPF